MPDFLTAENLVALLTLTALEIVLSIDNVVFIAILTGKLEPARQPRARQVGLALAAVTRILLLLSIAWIIGLVEPLFTVFGHEVSGRDLVLGIGGLFLIAKATWEIHENLEGDLHEAHQPRAPAAFGMVIVQILLLDLVFSLDSVITAVGMARAIWVMITAVLLAIGVMLVFAGAVSRFVERHPTIKMLALSFLLLIGVMLVVESLHAHIPKGYIYSAMAFSLFVELLNLRVHQLLERRRRRVAGADPRNSAKPQPE